MTWVRSGTIAVTAGSAVVNGAATDWSTPLVKAGYILVTEDLKQYEITSLNSETQLELSENYAGGTNSAATYVIIPTAGANVELHRKIEEFLEWARGRETDVTFVLQELETAYNQKVIELDGVISDKEQAADAMIAAKGQAADDMISAKEQAADAMIAAKGQAADDMISVKSQAADDMIAAKDQAAANMISARDQAAGNMIAAKGQAADDMIAAKEQAADTMITAKEQTADTLIAAKGQAADDMIAAKEQAADTMIAAIGLPSDYLKVTGGALSGDLLLPGLSFDGGANVLRHALRSTWVLADLSVNLALSVRYARYERIGHSVFVEFDFDYPINSSNSMSRINLPIAARDYASGIVGWSNNDRPIKIHVASAGLYFMDAGAPLAGNAHLQNAQLSGTRIIGSARYDVA